MHYISPKHKLALLQKNGNVGKYSTKYYQFYNGRLIIGSATASTAGNVIVPNLSATDGTALQILYPDGASDLAKVGQGTLGTDAALAGQIVGEFYASPYKTVAASTQALVIGLWYFVVTGTIVHNGTTYKQGTRFKATASSNFTGTGTVYQDLDANLWTMDDLDERTESYRIANLMVGDEATYDNSTMSVTEKAMGWTR